ncbi:hypothetical protein CP061683_1737, partial [Chlamydia psittaci 06-1683]
SKGAANASSTAAKPRE